MRDISRRRTSRVATRAGHRVGFWSLKTKTTAGPPIRVGMISLGCAKNLVDAEIMLGTLLRDGIEVTNDPRQADVMVVNTCSFIESAQEESVDAILESAAVREAQQRGQALVVAGCMPQRFGEQLPQLMPEVDAFMGIDQVPHVTQIIRQAARHREQRLAGMPAIQSELAQASRARLSPPAQDQPPFVQVNPRPVYIPDYATPRFRLTPKHFAYVKIAEGCNHPCSFCAIPRIRGGYRSRPQVDLVEEARRLLSEGVKELNLISQDTTYYGRDFRRNQSAPAATGKLASPTTLSTLLQALNGLRGDFWIRLLYTHPAHWTDELIRTMADCPKVVRYIDLPLQHIHSTMLERMRRETTSEQILEWLAKIRSGLPGVTLRTTFIVGFPGETETRFQALLDFVKSAQFERMGVFTYSPEDGTRAAKMTHPVPDKIKQQRRDILMQAQRLISRAHGARQMGHRLRVLVEKEAQGPEWQQAQVSSWEHGLVREPDRSRVKLAGRFFVARGAGDAPDIDGRVYVRGPLTPGEFVQVKIVGHTDYDLTAVPT
jgi:ribosomal protein S12 methylthiotransferase